MLINMVGKAQQSSRLVTMDDTITINAFICVLDSLNKKEPATLTDHQAYFKNEETIQCYLGRLDQYISGLEQYFLIKENGKFSACIQAKRQYYNKFMEKRQKELERLDKRFK